MLFSLKKIENHVDVSKEIVGLLRKRALRIKTTQLKFVISIIRHRRMYKPPLLLIMRHAKSVKGDLLTNDYHRPLDQEGQQQPKKILGHLKNLSVTIDAAVVSPSTRTAQTWMYVQKGLLGAIEPTFDPRLYQASCDDVIEVIHEHAHDHNTLLVVAHCPGVVEAVEFLTGEYYDFKPADMAILSPRSGSFAGAFDRRGQFALLKTITAHD